MDKIHVTLNCFMETKCTFLSWKKIKLVCWDMLLKENTCCLGWESEKHLYARACVFSLYNYVRRYWKKIDWHFGFYLNLIDLMYFYQFGLAGFMKIMAVLYIYLYIWIGFSKINILEFNWNICACIKKAHVQYFYFN
jgi:hypothetical protein